MSSTQLDALIFDFDGVLVESVDVKTRAFEVIFDSIDSIGTVTYDLDHGTFAISARTATSAVLRVRQTDSAWRETRVKPGQPDQNVTPRNGNVIS